MPDLPVDTVADLAHVVARAETTGSMGAEDAGVADRLLHGLREDWRDLQGETRTALGRIAAPLRARRDAPDAPVPPRGGAPHCRRLT